MSECKFIPYEKVLVRDANDQKWHIELFEKDLGPNEKFRYMCLAHTFTQCVSYEGNEHLLDTSKPAIAPYDLNDGDVVYLDIQGYSSIRIFHEVTADGTVYTYAEPLEMDKCSLKDGKYIALCDLKDLSEKILPASDELEAQYLSKMEKQGVKWNAEKKEFEACKWEPEEGEIFYTAYFDPIKKEFYADQSTWPAVKSDRTRLLLDRGWIFKTEKQCEPLCERLTQAIADVQ